MKNNRNVSELWWDTDSNNSIKTIREIYRIDGKIDKCYSISIVNGFKFSAYSDGAITSPFVVFDFDIDHPLFFPFYNLLNGSTELFIDDDFDRKYLKIYFTGYSIIMEFFNININDSLMKFDIVVDDECLKSRLYNFFYEASSSVTEDNHQLTFDEDLLRKRLGR